MAELSVYPDASPPEHIGAFREQLRLRRDRLVALNETEAVRAGGEFALAMEEIGEQLLVADEELRVQSEHLEESTRRLDRLIVAYEELFANAPVAYLQTDADGLLLRMNRAAARLFAIKNSQQRSRTLPGLVRPADRPAIRQALTRLRSTAGSSSGAAPEPIEAALLRADGHEVPVVLTVRRSSDADNGRVTLHWEVQGRGGDAPTESAQPGPPAVSLLAETAAELARLETPEDAVSQLVVRARQALPACDEVGLFLSRPRGHGSEPSALPGTLAVACERLQQEVHEGPGLTVLEAGRPVHSRDVAHDRRWPRFGRLAARGGVRSVIAVPLAAQRGVAGVLTFYGRRAGAFTDEHVVLARAYATHAAIALAHVQLEANLRIGLETREEIGRAVGILMERHRITAPAAFDLLVEASQRSQRKLREIAAWVTETGMDPAAFAAD